MPFDAAEIIKHYEYDPSRVIRVAPTHTKRKVAVVEPDPTWPQQFEALKADIEAALGPGALVISHVGSTSIPNMPAKDCIDIDLTVADVNDEESYVEPLKSAGWHFKNREPTWHGHRFFAMDSERSTGNLHVWGPDCPEAERHRIFRDWILSHEDDRALYVQAKRQAMEDTNKAGGVVMDYNLHKEATIREILVRAFQALGYM